MRYARHAESNDAGKYCRPGCEIFQNGNTFHDVPLWSRKDNCMKYYTDLPSFSVHKLPNLEFKAAEHHCITCKDSVWQVRKTYLEQE